MADVNNTLALAWGGRYVDDFIDRGRVKHVIVQADAPYRMQPSDFGRWYVRNASGQMVSLASVASSHWEYGSPQLARYNEPRAVEINGEAAPGVSSGEAMNEIERLVAQLPHGFSIDWTGRVYQERAAGAQLPMLYSLSLIVIFLCLAALYESWTIPTAIILAVPLGVVGAVIATALRGLERDIYFTVGMLTTIGLSCKNAILIIEFAKEYVEQGQSVIDATLHAVRDRLRPILMTSLAFGLGVLPLAIATGAGAGAQRAIGTGVFGGMLAGTFLGIFFIPVFFVVVQRTFHSLREPPARGTPRPMSPLHGSRRCVGRAATLTAAACTHGAALSRSPRCRRRWSGRSRRPPRRRQRRPARRRRHSTGSAAAPCPRCRRARRHRRRGRYRLARVLRRSAAAGDHRAGAREQPRSARRGAQYPGCAHAQYVVQRAQSVPAVQRATRATRRSTCRPRNSASRSPRRSTGRGRVDLVRDRSLRPRAQPDARRLQQYLRRPRPAAAPS